MLHGMRLYECYTRSVRVGKNTLGIVLMSVCDGGVNQADEGLGQPRQVMTAGMYGPSGQLIFDVVVPSV